MTDENGQISVKLPKDGSYAVKVNISLPEGYEAQNFYPLLTTDFTVEVSSSLLPAKDSFSGVTYTLGSVMNDFTVTNTEGEEITLSKLFEEKSAVLLNFWYVQCSACQLEFPFLQSAYEKYQDDVAVIALNPPHAGQDTFLDIQQFKSNYGLSFDVAQDNLDLYSAFNVEYYPTSVMIDRYGVVTLIEVGAVPSERAFDCLFGYYSADDYVQKLINTVGEIVPKEKPNVQMPSSDEMSNVFDKGNIDGIEYIPYPDTASNDEKEYSWPFVIDQVELGDEIYDVIKTSNANKEGSFAQLIMNVPLKAGDVLAFDYFSSTEKGADILYVVVDGKDIYSISGQNENGWETCYAFVAEEDATYEVGMVYSKDNDTNYELDTVYLKDLRIETVNDIDSATYIYRFAATKPNDYGAYDEYASIWLGEDGYYHVDSIDGPILLADLMGYTRFSGDNTVFNMAGELLESKKLSQQQYDRIVQYCSYASNSTIYGVSPVTEELRQLLLIISEYCGAGKTDENDWLRLCCYYDAYGTNGEQLEDPIKGLATFSAYHVIESEPGEEGYPNSFVYNRIIMPRGLYAKFTPEVSGTYVITTYAPNPDKEGFVFETEAWVFTKDNFDSKIPWYTYEYVDRNNIGYYMMLYLEAGKDYYIDIAYADVEQTGTINFRVEMIGGEGAFRFTQASPGPFTSLLSPSGELTETIIKGISVELDANGFYREKRSDGRLGSLVYADFTQYTSIFNGNVFYSDDPERIDMIEAGAFDFRYSEEDLYVLNYLKKVDGDVEKCKADLKKELGDAYNAKYTDYDADGSPYTVTGFAVEEVLAGERHGMGNDESAIMLEYAKKIIKAGDTVTVVNEDGTGTVEVVVEEGSPMIGCVAVDAELAQILQKLMDKYTFQGVENSWLKLCYYDHYFCAATPK
jgi:peroxiredoxin